MADVVTATQAHSPIQSGFGFRLLNEFQREFPLIPAPYAALAAHLGVRESEVIEALLAFQAHGTLSRVGAVFAPNSVGVSTLAALHVPEPRLAHVAAVISARREVSHNYEREGEPNLWFVINAANDAVLDEAVRAIESETGYGPVLRLPLIEEYRIDLGFDLRGAFDTQRSARWQPVRGPALLTARDRGLMVALQAGLPVERFPYLALGHSADMQEAEVLERLRGWIDAGVIRRFGLIVRHRELGYRANAMVVWDVPDTDVGALGQALAQQPRVTLCYRRRRCLPDWPFNLYCMIHGRERRAVTSWLRGIERACGLDRHPSRMLFSRARYKQRGALYFPDRADGHPSA